MRRKVCVVTGSRAEFGLLRPLMQRIRQSGRLELQLVATGMHLAPEFGSTVEEIEAEGFTIDRRVEMLLSGGTPAAVTKSMGVGMIGLADAFVELRPDLLLVLGDRFEIFSAAAAATIARLPIAHLHGGETTEGAVDEAFRHSITKMAHLHFVAANEYRERVIQLGEDPSRVFTVGGLGVDNIKSMKLLGREELETVLGFSFGAKSLMVTFHPVTLEPKAAETQTLELLSALEELQDTQLIFSAPNADVEGSVVRELMGRFVADRPNAKLFASLGTLRYLSCLRHVDGVVGNSSSGLTEVPSFEKGTVNIGDRQRGRLKASSVIDCDPTRLDIRRAIRRLYADDFRAGLAHAVNPYGQGGASEKIVEVLENYDASALLKKHFHDLLAAASRR